MRKLILVCLVLITLWSCSSKDAPRTPPPQEPAPSESPNNNGTTNGGSNTDGNNTGGEKPTGGNNNTGGDGDGSDPGTNPAPTPEPTPQDFSVTFTPVGDLFGTPELIDLEFLPGGDALVISKDGDVFYMDADFTRLAGSFKIDVLNSGEQGMLNVAADPNFSSNKFVFFYYTLPDGSGNQVDRFTLSVNKNEGTITLSDRQQIITMVKSESPSPGTNHNGGAMLFDGEGSMLLGVGDGGGDGSPNKDFAIGQNTSIRLGKILRINPSRTNDTGGFQPAGAGLGGLPEIYHYGLRNPFTLALANGKLFIGDVGSNVYEEINLALNGGLNFGWPIVEGPAGDGSFIDPLHGFSHEDKTFINEDSQATDSGARSLMIGDFYTGSRYNNLLTNRLIYSEHYVGWVRGFKLDANNKISDDRHLGHLTGLTSLQEGPDGFLYAISLFGSEKILKLNVEIK